MVSEEEAKAFPKVRRSDHAPQLGINSRAPFHIELSQMLMTAISPHQGKGKGPEYRYSRVPLWVCVAQHDFHSLCVCAPGYSIISFSCCFSPSCVSIRVHCRIPIYPHMPQKLLSSLLKIFPEPEASNTHNSQWSPLGRHCSGTYQGLLCYLPLISCK